MSRLSSLPPRIGAAPYRVSQTPKAEGLTTSRRSNPLKGLYSTARWRTLRLKVFQRDGYICQRSGALCSGKHPAPNSPVANHKRPHRGNPALFWDEDNLETVTKEVHDTLIQAEEQENLRHAGVWD